MIQRKFFLFIWIAILSVIGAACSGDPGQEITSSVPMEAEILVQYLEENGDVLNHPDVPFFINALDVHNRLKANNMLVIDVRNEREFNRGHIENSAHVLPENILDYFENRIEPNSFDKIVIVCNNSHLSAYTTAILRMLGYDNVHNLRFGLSSWDLGIARRNWYANIGDDLLGRLETAPHPKNEAGALPTLKTGKKSGYEILRARAEEALKIDWDEIAISFMDILEYPDSFYVGNYWPQNLYDMGHLPEAIQYDPKKSLRSDEYLNTLPTDKAVVMYCFTGQNSAYVNAYLTLLGYEVRSLDYGANSFIHQTLFTTQRAGRSFSEQHIMNFPLIRDNLSLPAAATQRSPEKVEVTTVEGGC